MAIRAVGAGSSGWCELHLGSLLSEWFSKLGGAMASAGGSILEPEIDHPPELAADVHSSAGSR